MFRSYEPADLIPPGETLAEWLREATMTQADFSRRTRLTPKHISQVVTGKVGISPEVALAFERVTSIPARYWTQLDANYQTAHQEAKEDKRLEKYAELVDRFPVRELEKRGLPRRSSKVGQLRELLHFFAVADPEALDDVWLQPALYRQSRAFQADPGSLASWLRLAELRASRIETAEFDSGMARNAIPEMRELSRLPGIEWVRPLVELCASVGIALVILRELPKCRINGATKWISPEKAMIALSLRHRRNDIFWFTLFHELHHLLHHSKKKTFVDVSGDGIDEELEAEADAFASRVLIPQGFVAELAELSTKTEVEEFAEALGVAPGIVVGRMQHEQLIPHRQWADLIERYRFTDEV